MKIWAGWLSLVFAFIPPGMFALSIFLGKLPPQNVATWGMVLLLDTVGLLLAYKAYKEKDAVPISEMPFLQMGWFIAAVCIMYAVLSRSNVIEWRMVETLSLLCCIASVYLWATRDAKSGLYPYMLAMYIAFLPQLFDYWREPQPDTWWLWAGTIVGAMLAIYAAEKRTFDNCFVAWACLPLNAIALAVVLL